jgi:hypothetical protein
LEEYKMAETDWNFLSSGLSASSVARGVSSGFDRPNGGGSYLFGFNSLDDSLGAVGLYANQTNFNPLVDDSSNPTGCSIRGAIKRGVSANPLDFSPFFFAGIQGVTVNDSCYMLGLSNADPYNIMLVKGTMANGMPSTTSADTVLDFSTETFTPDTWHHLRLDVIVNPNGDVVLNVYQNDLDTYAVTSPTWTAIDGLSQFIDDALGANSYDKGNSDTPYVGGRAGFGFNTNGIQRRALFDHIELYRQK